MMPRPPGTISSQRLSLQCFNFPISLQFQLLAGDPGYQKSTLITFWLRKGTPMQWHLLMSRGLGIQLTSFAVL